MKYLDEFRNPQHARQLLKAIRQRATRCWRIMDVCGGQTHNLLRNGIEQSLEGVIELIHGPGCPVCVTPAEVIDQAIELAGQPGICLMTFADMLRVPGTKTSLQAARAHGHQVRMSYSPLDAVKYAREHSDVDVVFLAVGFETTAPATALAVKQARQLRLNNFSLLTSHVRVLPAMRQIAFSPECCIDGFLAAGHVCTVTGYAEYAELAQQSGLPILITGFEPLDLLQGIRTAVDLLEQGQIDVINEYSRAVKEEGNPAANQLLTEVFEVVDQSWRGLGVLPASGLGLRKDWQEFDARHRYHLTVNTSCSETKCRSGEVLQGRLKPGDCAEFGVRCHPGHPLGAPMVSSEGTCAAYYQYYSLRSDHRSSISE